MDAGLFDVRFGWAKRRGCSENEAQREFRITYKYVMNLLLLDERQIKVSHFLELARNAWVGR